MERSSRNFRLEFLENGSGTGGSTGGVNPLQVLPECSGSTQKQPRDGSVVLLVLMLLAPLTARDVFQAPAPEFFAPVADFLWCCTHFLLRKTK
jgi:hypothetical protein